MEKSVIKFSAEGMRELANQSQRSLENKEFENVEDSIIAAAQLGHYSLNLTLDYNTTIKALKELGFTVGYADPPMELCGYGRMPSYYEVSWFNKQIP